MTLMFLDLYSISPNYPHPVQLCVLLFIPIVALGPIILLDQHLEGPILTLRALRIRALNDLSYYLIRGILPPFSLCKKVQDHEGIFATLDAFKSTE